MLCAKSLQKRFGARQVVHDFGFAMQQGEVMGLFGPNGSGKTTCFYMLAGLIQADAGCIQLNARPITGLPMHARARLGIGYLPQEASVFRRLSVADNIRAVLELRRELSARQRAVELVDLLDELKITHISEQKGISLSGGERRRVEIARALAMKPHYMLLDEPFAGVDPISVGEIQRIVLYLSDRGIGVLITDHNVRETLAICDHATILYDGQVLAQGDPAALLANEKVREFYLGHESRL